MPEMIETVAISDIFVTRLARLEWVARDVLRFYFCADTDGENVLVAKLVVPLDCVRDISATRLRLMKELGAVEAVIIPRRSGSVA